MPRYETDRYGMISSFDIAEALRRAERRRLEEDRRRLERQDRAAARNGLLTRVRALLATPRRSAA